MRARRLVLPRAVAAPADAISPSRPTPFGDACTATLAALQAEVDRAARAPIPLADPPHRAPGYEDAGEPCEHFDKALAAFAELQNPHSERGHARRPRRRRLERRSTRQWPTIGTSSSPSRSTERHVGACLTTTTTGVRNVGSSDQMRHFGVWRLFAGDRLHVVVYRRRGLVARRDSPGAARLPPGEPRAGPRPRNHRWRDRPLRPRLRSARRHAARRVQRAAPRRRRRLRCIRRRTSCR